MPGAQLIAASGLNQGLVRFGDDTRTEAVIAAINASGEAFFGGVTWRGRRAMRISACNWRTTDADIARILAAIREIVDSVK